MKEKEKGKENKKFLKKKSSNKLLNTDNTLSDSSQNYGHDRKKEKSSRHQTKVKRNTSKNSTNRSKNSNHEKEKEKKVSHRSDSMDSTDRIIVSLPKNKNGLRPPFVWNFPIERIEEIFLIK